jgi:hypothetical protein
LNDDRRPPESSDQSVPSQEAPGPSVRAILRFGEQTPGIRHPREQAMIGRRIWRIEPRRKHDDGPPPSIERPFMRGAIDADCAAGDDDGAVERNFTSERVRKVERFVVGAAGADDGEGTLEVGQLTDNAKAIGGVGEITEPDGIVRRGGSH